MASQSLQGGSFRVAHHLKYLLFLSFICLSAIHIGLSAYVVSRASDLVETFMRFESGVSSRFSTSAATRAIQYLPTIGRIAGLLVPLTLGRWLGRKPALWLACGLAYMSNIMLQLSTDVAPIRAGVFLSGISYGVFEAYAQIYIVECSPERFRTLSIFIFTALTAFGKLASFFSSSCPYNRII